MKLLTRDGQAVLLLSGRWRVFRGQRRRARGWRMAADGVSCTRPGRWGNPYIVGRDGDAQDCVERFQRLLTKPSLAEFLPGFLAPLVARYRQHGSITLYCYCTLDAPCHCAPLGAALVTELERLEATP